MPRRPRLHVPGGFYHITLRGNGRQAIFFDDEDPRRWQQCLQKGVERYEHRVHAYCWMTNHVHLAIQASADPLSGFMAFLSSQYARSTNRKMGRSGHLFERRYGATLVQEDSYLKELVRYIHFNPLRASMVTDLTAYRWSSHNAYSEGSAPVWLTVDHILSLFGDSDQLARRRYAKFMSCVQTETMTKQFRHGSKNDDRLLGDDAWQRNVLEKLDTETKLENLDGLVLRLCEQYGVTEAELESPSRERRFSRVRAEVALAATEHGIATVTDVARRFGRTQPGLSRTMNLLRGKLNKL